MKGFRAVIEPSGSSRGGRRLSGFALILACAAAATLPAGEAAAEELAYGCVMTEMQVVPPTGSTAIGAGQFIIDTEANTLSYRIAFTGLSSDEVAAHIHGYAGPGEQALIAHYLPPDNPKVGVWNYAEAVEADILAGRTYVNIHTTMFNGGEIRGQIVPLNASLDGAQQNPPVDTGAAGWGVCTIDTDANELSYHIAFDGLSSAETAAHIHGFALHGAGAGPLHTLPAGSPKVGTWSYMESQEAGILEGRTYINVHTADFPDGEIRGQIVPIVAPIDGAQEDPDTDPSGAGIGLIAYDPDGDALSYDITFAGLTSPETAAHIHGFAPPDSSAGVLHTLPMGERKIGAWSYGSADEEMVFAGLTYINIHSEMFPAGEIRGQIEGFRDQTTVSVGELDAGQQSAFRLNRIAPNPLRGETGIGFALDEAMPVRLAVYDARGRLVRVLAERRMAAGDHVVSWNGRDAADRPVASGVYRARLATPNGEATRQVTVLR
ncbi:MAG: CHRD domain-containing protein [Candidatus Eisenbacteria bacterium]|nr:CHRD domain-containing protein [Candidatus Latescibacterota bacterium]MBD3302645.1 CHRD domain-containing protein [Candidatus Eisenbacteria bacterium]